jgi:DNA-binding MarR family transcriptional regulator
MLIILVIVQRLIFTMTEDIDNHKKSKEKKGKPCAFDFGWLTITQQLCSTLLTQFPRLSDLRVALAVCEHADYHNGIKASQGDIAAELGISRATVSRAYNRLRKLDMIEIRSGVGEPIVYRINPEFAWRGSGKSHQVALWQRENERR